MTHEGPIRIAIDAMGGDHGPSVAVAAALEVLQSEPGLHIVLVGPRAALQPLLGARAEKLAPRLTTRDASQVVLMEDKPQDALRRKKDSSMRVAIDLVKAGEADACVSAGNTGALMATARFVLKTVEGIDRPAILKRIPARHGYTHVLDLGANADCSAEHLAQFAVMGAAVAADAEGMRRPRVGLLNIGSEEIKGHEVVQEAARLLSASSLNYVGFVEGNDIFSGKVDVVVTDGFSGNVALKAMEGLVTMLADTLKREFTRTPLRQLGALVSWPVIKAVKRSFDPRTYNGASMVGLKGVVIKSHGSADAYAFANAIRAGFAEVRKDVPQKIQALLGGEHMAAAKQEVTTMQTGPC